MAENVVLNSGTGGDTVAADDIAGVKHQRVKLSLGADGTAADAPVGGGVESGVLRVTIASDSTGVLSVDDNGSSLTVDNGGTFAVQATLAAETTKVIGTVNIAAAQTVATVTTVSAVTAISNALPAGTNNIGDVDIASIAAGDNNIGNVDIVSLPASTNTIEVVGDAAHDAVAAGNPLLIGGYASATEPADVSADGDAARIWVLPSGMQPITIRDSVGDSAMDDTNNALRVNIVAGAAAGGTSQADDADFTAGTTAGTPIQGVYESSPTSVTDGDVGTVGITATRALKVAVASGGIAGAVVDSVAGATDEGVLSVVVRDDALATLTPVDGDYTQLRTNARGAQWVALDSTAAQTVTLAAGTATNEVVGDAAADAAVAGNPLYMGARASTAIPTAMSADGDAVGAWADLNGALVVTGRIVDDAAFTPGTSRVHPVGLQADETGTDSVDEGDAGCPRMTLDRKQIVTIQPHTQGGLTIFRSLDIDETEEEVKATAGQLYFIHAMNLVATLRYLKFYNATAANVTVGTTTPVLTFPIPANSTTGAGFTVAIPQGFPFSTAISVACTTGLADNDTGAPGASDVVINLGYA